MSDSSLRDDLLAALRIKGFARPDVLAACFADDRVAFDREIESLRAAGYIEETKIGLRLTASAAALADVVFARDRAALDADAIGSAYERFSADNDEFKATMMRWQMRDAGGNGNTVPNDHTDAAYDAEILDRIATIDERVALILQSLSERIPRLAAYRRRFAHALERARSGERRYVAAPIIDSYHTVWFELHEDLIRLSGRTRAAEAAAGRGA